VQLKVEQWSGKHALPADRSSLTGTPQRTKRAWSDAGDRGDRTRLAPTTTPATQGTPTSRSSARPGVDRTRSTIVIGSKPRVAESWSSVREHEDRTWIRATVDIRERELRTESWSDLREQVDRIRIEGAATQSSLSWTTRTCAGGAAVSAATVVLFLSAPAALADAQPNGTAPAATAGQVTPTTSDTTSTTSSTVDTGTPVATQSMLGPSSASPAGTDTLPNGAAGGANAHPDPGGQGNPTVVGTAAGNPGITG